MVKTGPGRFAKAVNELHAKRFMHMMESYYAIWLDAKKRLSIVSANSKRSPILFSTFEDRNGYNGYKLSPYMAKTLYCKLMSIRAPFYDRFLQTLPVTVVSVDNTFNVSFFIYIFVNF